MSGQLSIYLDANPIIYAVEGDLDVATPVRRLFLELRQVQAVVVTSELTLAEVLAKKGLPIAKRREYIGFLVNDRWIELRPVDRPTLYDAARIRALTGRKLADAIHLATAVRAGASAFVSRDGHFKAMPSGLRWVNTDAPSLSEFVDTLK